MKYIKASLITIGSLTLTPNTLSFVHAPVALIPAQGDLLSTRSNVKLFSTPRQRWHQNLDPQKATSARNDFNYGSSRIRDSRYAYTYNMPPRDMRGYRTPPPPPRDGSFYARRSNYPAPRAPLGLHSMEKHHRFDDRYRREDRFRQERFRRSSPDYPLYGPFDGPPPSSLYNEESYNNQNYGNDRNYQNGNQQQPPQQQTQPMNHGYYPQDQSSPTAQGQQQQVSNKFPRPYPQNVQYNSQQTSSDTSSNPSNNVQQPTPTSNTNNDQRIPEQQNAEIPHNNNQPQQQDMPMDSNMDNDRDDYLPEQQGPPYFYPEDYDPRDDYYPPRDDYYYPRNDYYPENDYYPRDDYFPPPRQFDYDFPPPPPPQWRHARALSSDERYSRNMNSRRNGRFYN